MQGFLPSGCKLQGKTAQFIQCPRNETGSGNPFVYSSFRSHKRVRRWRFECCSLTIMR
jgi:hypothetical protein